MNCVSIQTQLVRPRVHSDISNERISTDERIDCTIAAAHYDPLAAEVEQLCSSESMLLNVAQVEGMGRGGGGGVGGGGEVIDDRCMLIFVFAVLIE
jgi:hypothetical protein